MVPRVKSITVMSKGFKSERPNANEISSCETFLGLQMDVAASKADAAVASAVKRLTAVEAKLSESQRYAFLFSIPWKKYARFLGFIRVTVDQTRG